MRVLSLKSSSMGLDLGDKSQGKDSKVYQVTNIVILYQYKLSFHVNVAMWLSFSGSGLLINYFW